MSNDEPSDRWDCWNHSLPPTFDSPPCTSDRRQAFAAGRVSRWDTNSRTDGPADRTCDMFDSRFRCRRNSPSVVRDMRSSSLVWFRWRLLPVMAVNWTKRNINYSHGIFRLNKRFARCSESIRFVQFIFMCENESWRFHNKTPVVAASEFTNFCAKCWLASFLWHGVFCCVFDVWCEFSANVYWAENLYGTQCQSDLSIFTHFTLWRTSRCLGVSSEQHKTYAMQIDIALHHSRNFMRIQYKRSICFWFHSISRHDSP